MSADLPQAAVTAAAEAWRAWYAERGWNESDQRVFGSLFAAMLEAAAPHLAAAERERIRQLAYECIECGKPHERLEVPPDSPFSFNGRTWADPADGHAYAPRHDVPGGPCDRKLADLLRQP